MKIKNQAKSYTLTGPLKKPITDLLMHHPSASGENDWNLCGTWRHGNNPLTLAVNISTGCHTMTVSANQSSLSVAGQFTAHCSHVDMIDLTKQFGVDPSVETPFCLFWEPSLDQLKLKVSH